MRCKKCGGGLKVIRTREALNDIYRERRCVLCGCAFYTRESVEIGASYQLKKLISPVERGVK